MDPLRRRTSLARNHHMRPMEWADLLLQGTGMSMNLVGESTMGMLAWLASVTGWWSVRGSLMRSRRGSRKAAWIWLVRAPGVKRPAMGVAPT